MYSDWHEVHRPIYWSVPMVSSNKALWYALLISYALIMGKAISEFVSEWAVVHVKSHILDKFAQRNVLYALVPCAHKTSYSNMGIFWNAFLFLVCRSRNSMLCMPNTHFCADTGVFMKSNFPQDCRYRSLVIYGYNILLRVNYRLAPMKNYVIIK